MTTYKKRYPFGMIWLMILLTALLLYLFSGCRTVKTSTSTTEKEVIKHDTTFIKVVETIHDSTIIIQPDNMAISALMECDSMGNAYLKQIVELRNGKRIKSTIEMRFDTLFITAEIDSMAIYFQYKSVHEQVFKGETSDITNNSSVKETKKVTRFPWWFWLIAAGVVAFFVVKYYLKIKPF